MGFPCFKYLNSNPRHVDGSLKWPLLRLALAARSIDDTLMYGMGMLLLTWG